MNTDSIDVNILAVNASGPKIGVKAAPYSGNLWLSPSNPNVNLFGGSLIEAWAKEKIVRVIFAESGEIIDVQPAPEE